MIHRQQILPTDTLPLYAQNYMTEDMLLFDIETTGLSPRTDSVYLIGCSYIQGNEVVIDLFFGESPEDEPVVFDAFMPVLLSHSTVITFNGTTFDIPFLKKRCPALCPVFDNMESVDLYREARSMKVLLRLDSYKQKSIETFLGCAREDKYSGGELIGMYLEYILHQDPQNLEILLLHNFDDVKGMYDLLGLMAYYQLKNGEFDIIESSIEACGEKHYLNVKIQTRLPVPATVNLSDEESILILEKGNGLIRFLIHHDELKHFFPDFKNYYYLPDEDCAVHKSVGQFVDPSHRKAASATTCYVKKTCDYITLNNCNADSTLKKSLKDKSYYQALPAENDEFIRFLSLYFSHYFTKKAGT